MRVLTVFMLFGKITQIQTECWLRMLAKTNLCNNR